MTFELPSSKITEHPTDWQYNGREWCAFVNAKCVKMFHNANRKFTTITAFSCMQNVQRFLGPRLDSLRFNNMNNKTEWKFWIELWANAKWEWHGKIERRNAFKRVAWHTHTKNNNKCMFRLHIPTDIYNLNKPDCNCSFGFDWRNALPWILHEDRKQQALCSSCFMC